MKDKLNADLKAAMLARDSFLTDVIKGLKAAILNQEIAQQKRDEGLSDSEIETLLGKEAKKREEAAGLYEQGGNAEMAAKERREQEIIRSYLPEQLGEAELERLVAEAMIQTGATSQQDMGKVIGAVKANAGGGADGSLIAQIVKKHFEQK